MRPYRLINTTELKTLQQHFYQIVHDWNEAYCITPLHLNLSLVPKNYNLDETYLIHELDHLELGLIAGDYLWIINQALFAHNHPSFHAVSQELLLQLLSSLFKTNDCELQHHTASQNPDWFYAGSTCLLATLSCNQNHFTLLINPEWVYQQLPQGKAKGELHTLDEAVAEQTIRFNLELEASNLLVKNLANIQVGDVLSTTHPLTTPLRLMHENEVFAQAELGYSAQHKSIVLKRLP